MVQEVVRCQLLVVSEEPVASCELPVSSAQTAAPFNAVIPSGAAAGSAVEGPAVPETRNSKLETDNILGLTLAQLLKRPEVQIEQLAPLLARLMPTFFQREEVSSCEFPVSSAQTAAPFNAVIPSGASSASAVEGPVVPQLETRNLKLETAVRNELKSVETEIKYSGYLDQQTKAIERLKRSEQRAIPDWFDYGKVSGLSREMNEKLVRVRPRTLGQASRIPGVTPAAVSLINVYIEIQARQQASARRAVLPSP
jgi:tRNA uridine 5-carboxymethylaminomethyl modification enzyme